MSTLIGFSLTTVADLVNTFGQVPPLEIHALTTKASPQQVVMNDGGVFVLNPRTAQSTASITEQETVVAATNARTIGELLEADDALVSLPENSSLKAVFESDTMVTERLANSVRYTLYKGHLRIVDANGVERARVWVEDAALILDASIEADEVNFEVHGRTGNGHPKSVRIQLNPDKGQDAKTVGVRWKELPADESGKPLRLKMEFTGDRQKATAAQ